MPFKFMNHKIYIIVAAEENFGIGKNGVMPWNFKNELKHFQDVTTKTGNPDKQNMVIMGRTTWESIPEKHRPLKNRRNVVLTRNADFNLNGAKVFNSLDEAINSADDTIENIFIIGGASVYRQAIEDSRLDGIYITKINKSYDCDTFFPQIPSNFNEPVTLGGAEEDDVNYEYLFYGRKTLRP